MRQTQLIFCDDCPKREACDTEEDKCQLVKFVDQSTRASGVPFYVTDRLTLQRIARLLAVES